MRRVLFAILLVAAPCGAFALTWDFDDGSTYGWTARESTIYSNKLGSNDPLQTEIVNGVLAHCAGAGSKTHRSIARAADWARLGPVRPHYPTVAPRTP